MRRDSRRARLIGFLTALGGVIVLLSTLPGLGGRIGRMVDVVTPFGVRVTSHVIAVAAGVALLYLAGQIKPPTTSCLGFGDCDFRSVHLLSTSCVNITMSPPCIHLGWWLSYS